MSAAIRERYETMIKPEEMAEAAAAGSLNIRNEDTEAGSLSLSMQRLEARRRAAARPV